MLSTQHSLQILLSTLALFFSVYLQAGAEALPAPADFLKGKQVSSGFINFAVDPATNKIFLDLARFDSEFIYQNSLPQGLGSNDIGLDRGQLGKTRLVRFERAGSKVLLRQLNTQYRSSSSSPLERQAVVEAFASSVLWGFPVVAADENRVIVDATRFVLQDIHGVARRLKQQNEGVFKVDESRSAFSKAKSKAFPANTELEAVVTLTGDEPGKQLRSVAPDAYSFSVNMRHSFIALPDDDYKPRAFHPQSGFLSRGYQDYSAAIDAPLARRFIPRHRLRKKQVGVALSEPVEPIIYYLDPGTPEPVRGALLDGARWWNQAFEAAGYKDAFQVRMLPSGADPMDVRYNVIQWVHRSTRGWSYGASVIDPRTGEILKGHVSLGSLRVRQDYLIAQGMTAPFTKLGADTAPLKEMALARIRQLAAHEIGHTLGLAHNFAASTGNNNSVMDYPQPYIHLDPAGSVSLAGTYATDIGLWDKRTISYGYGEWIDAASESQALKAILADNRAQGFAFISDPDSRTINHLHPLSHLWDTGGNSLDEFDRIVALRQQALSDFSASAIPFGAAYSDLEAVLVPVYFYHRYQAEAVGKWLGGSYYTYAQRQPGVPFQQTSVLAVDQVRAMNLLLATLSPAFLNLSDDTLALIPPMAYGHSRTRENPSGLTGLLMDPISMAEAAAQQTLDIVMHPERLARLQLNHARDDKAPGVAILLKALGKEVLKRRHSGREREIQQRVSAAITQHWMRLVRHPEAVAPEVQALLHQALLDAKAWYMTQAKRGAADYRAFYTWQAHRISQYENSEQPNDMAKPRQAPPGSPI
jgi:hypothetical protein